MIQCIAANMSVEKLLIILLEITNSRLFCIELHSIFIKITNMPNFISPKK